MNTYKYGNIYDNNEILYDIIKNCLWHEPHLLVEIVYGFSCHTGESMCTVIRKVYKAITYGVSIKHVTRKKGFFYLTVNVRKFWQSIIEYIGRIDVIFYSDAVRSGHFVSFGRNLSC
jgi:hypothetical protein